MEIKLAEKCGFCFGVKRAIRLAESNAGATTIGELIHNSRETDRLEKSFGVRIAESIEEIAPDSKVIIRTHGIERDKKERLETIAKETIDATCPYVTKLQKIAEKMSGEGYQVVIFGDRSHPEVRGVLSYAGANAIVVANETEIDEAAIESRAALISQTTKAADHFALVAARLARIAAELRVFNTICNATFENQEATRKLAREVDLMVIVGGKNSSNTKQLFKIASEICAQSVLIEEASELKKEIFAGKKVCGVTAGASTPDWIIQEVVATIKAL